MTLQQKAQEYVEASGLSLKTDKGEQAYNAYIAGAKENMEVFANWTEENTEERFIKDGVHYWNLYDYEIENLKTYTTKELIETYLKQQE